MQMQAGGFGLLPNPSTRTARKKHAFGALQMGMVGSSLDYSR